MAKVKTRMKHPILCIICAVISVFSVILAGYGGKLTRDLTRKPLNFNELTPDNAADGINVDGLIYAANGTYGQTYNLDKDGNIRQDVEMNYYFLVPVNDNYCITFLTNDTQRISSLYELTLATEKFSKGETETIEYANFYVSGRMVSLTDDERDHLYEWAISGNMFGAADAAGVDKYVLPYKIYELNTSAGLPSLIVGSVMFVVFSFLVLVLAKQRVSEDDEDY